MCVFESRAQREKVKIRKGTKKGRQKVGERCQFESQEGEIP